MCYFGGAFAARSISEKDSRTNTYHRDNRKTDSEREREERGKRGARQARARMPIAGLNYRRCSSLFHCQLNLMIAAGYCVFIVRPTRGSTVYAVNGDPLITHTFTHASRRVSFLFVLKTFRSVVDRNIRGNPVSDRHYRHYRHFFHRSSALLSKLAPRHVFLFAPSVRNFSQLKVLLLFSLSLSLP